MIRASMTFVNKKTYGKVISSQKKRKEKPKGEKVNLPSYNLCDNMWDEKYIDITTYKTYSILNG